MRNLVVLVSHSGRPIDATCKGCDPVGLTNRPKNHLKNLKEEMIMKKIVCVVGIVMLFASMVFAAGISKKDLAGLKGTWEGKATGAGGSGVTAKFEIMNDTEPLQGKLTLYNIPNNAQREYGISGTITGESNDGKITSAGTIMFTGGNGFFEIESIKDNTLKGWGFFRGIKANITAKKK